MIAYLKARAERSLRHRLRPVPVRPQPLRRRDHDDDSQANGRARWSPRPRRTSTTPRPGEPCTACSPSSTNTRSRHPASDIRYKMGQKVIKQAALRAAPIGYLNVRIQHEGRKVRTVAVDPERAPFVRWPSSCTPPESTASTTPRCTHRRRAAHSRHQPPGPGPHLVSHKIGNILQRPLLPRLRHLRRRRIQRSPRTANQPELFDQVQQVLDNERGGGPSAPTTTTSRAAVVRTLQAPTHPAPHAPAKPGDLLLLLHLP